MRRVPLTLVTGPANAEKAGYVLGAYAAAAAREPILVVPTFADVQTYRRELADRGVVFGARVETWARLSSELVRRAGVSGRVLSGLARERVTALAVARTELRVLGPAAQTPGFVPALLRLVDELGAARVDPGRWYAAVRAWAAAEPRRGDYAEDLGALYSAYRRAQERLGRLDREQQIAQALDVLRTEPARWRGTPVFLYGFDDLSAAQRDAVETLAVHVDVDVTASLPYEPGRMAFAGRHETHAHLDAIATQRIALEARSEHYEPAARAVLHQLERNLFEPAGGTRVDPAEAVLLLRGGGARAELELVAAHVARLLGEGVAAEEIAVVIRRAREHAALVESVFGSYGIAIASPREVAVAHTALGRGVLALARCALQPDDASADDLLAWLRTPGLLRVPALADALEQQLRQNGVGDAAAARARFEAEHFRLDAIERVRAAADRGPAELCERLAAEASSLFANPFRGRGAVLAPDEVVDAQVAARLRRALSELSALAEVDAALVPTGADLLRTLGDLRVRVGRFPGPGVVTVADPKDVRARRVRALFCCSLQEGVFPAPVRPEPFLSDGDRFALNSASGLRLALHEDALGRERYLFYATVSRPTELLGLSWHAADEDGGPTVRSLFVDDVLDLLVVNPPIGERPLGAAGFADDATAPPPPTERERARAAVVAATPVEPQPIAPLGDTRVLAALAARETWSASALESWLACPVRWFVERVLRPAELVPDPEPLIRGTLAHAVLERALSQLHADGQPRPLRSDDLPDAWRLAHAAIDELRHDVRLSPNPERARAALHRLEGDVLRYLNWAAENGSVFAPAEFELRFGGRDDPQPAVDLGDGLKLSGRIDRVDRGPGGDVLVIDYKGASATPQAKWAQDNRLQLALYALALPEVLEGVARVAGALYQPLGAKDRRPRGALREDADPDLRSYPTDRVDDERFSELLDEARARAVAAVAAAKQGALRPSPDTCGWGGSGCSYPSICRCERG
jgi:ATP-dependent helicase/DNAse subunit B